MGDVVWIKCRLDRGLYSHERTYTIAAPSEGVYQGAVQVHFCRDARGNPIPDEYPEKNDVGGEVQGVVVRLEENGNLLVAIPGDQNIIISPNLISEVDGPRRVPVRS